MGNNWKGLATIIYITFIMILSTIVLLDEIGIFSTANTPPSSELLDVWLPILTGQLGVIAGYLFGKNGKGKK